jgi:VIT1/CCC1 family predicted Fe2+/Mn2+ transporter
MLGFSSVQDKIEKLKQAHLTGKADEQFHKLVFGRYIGDAVYGSYDGIITSFAVVAGVAGANLSSAIVLILGGANLLATGFSMASGNYLARKSEMEYRKTERVKEEWEIKNLADEERQEIREIYQAKGFSGVDLERAVEIITSNPKLWTEEMMRGELKIMDDKDAHPIQSAATTFVSFVLAGAVPLLPYVFGRVSGESFVWATIFTVLVLFSVGSLRTVVTGRRWWLSGIEMLVIGLLAATLAYFVGELLGSLA